MVRIEYFDENWGTKEVMTVNEDELSHWRKILSKGGYVIIKLEKI